jgi:glycosyltransferase involved in cell wall biosynthesis
MRIVATNILYPTLTKSQVVGGAEVTVRTVYEELANLGHDVTVIRGTGPDGEFGVEDSNGVRVYTLPIKNAYWPFDKEERSSLQKLMWHVRDDFGRAPDRYLDIIDTVKPDVCAFHNVAGISWRSLQRAKSHGFPVVQVLHDYYYACPRGTLFKDGHTCQRPCTDCRGLSVFRRRATKIADSLSCVSQRVLDIMESEGLFANAKLKAVINNPVYRFGEGGHERGEEVIFGYLGRASAEKGIYLLAEAFRQMPAQCRLFFAGNFGEDEKRKIIKLAERDIEFLGFIEPAQFFSKIDVLVVPSLWDEPFGRVVVEGQAMHVPSVCSDRGGLPEALGGSANGWLFDPSSVENLVNVMQEIVDQPSVIDEKAEAGFDRSQSFSARSVALKYEALFEQTIALKAREKASVG